MQQNIMARNQTLAVSVERLSNIDQHLVGMLNSIVVKDMNASCATEYSPRGRLLMFTQGDTLVNDHINAAHVTKVSAVPAICQIMP
jgi:hypothetical protein